MTLQKIRNNIKDKKGNKVKIIYNGSRNKKEEYKGKISEIYNFIFMIKTSNNEKKSFSYSDILTKTVEIYFDNNKM